MANETGGPPIIIKKIKKVSGGGHHGGAWKIAYADFVTAMMAFFLLLWLLNATTEEQKQGIAQYFSPVSVSITATSGTDGVGSGKTLTEDGPMTADSAPLTPPPAEEKPASLSDSNKAAEVSKKENITDEVTDAEYKKETDEREQEAFKKAEQELKQAIESSLELKELAKNLIIDQTPEGLRIQIIDQDKKAMFPSGGSEMEQYAIKLHEKVAEIIKKMPNKISITGHTDATPYTSKQNYSNWELSSERSNASRRALVNSGVTNDRVFEVTGRAEKDLLKPEAPNDPQNRRISIVLLKESIVKQYEKEYKQNNTLSAGAQAAMKEAPSSLQETNATPQEAASAPTQPASPASTPATPQGGEVKKPAPPVAKIQANPTPAPAALPVPTAAPKPTTTPTPPPSAAPDLKPNIESSLLN